MHACMYSSSMLRTYITYVPVCMWAMYVCCARYAWACVGTHPDECAGGRSSRTMRFHSHVTKSACWHWPAVAGWPSIATQRRKTHDGRHDSQEQKQNSQTMTLRFFRRLDICTASMIYVKFDTHARVCSALVCHQSWMGVPPNVGRSLAIGNRGAPMERTSQHWS